MAAASESHDLVTELEDRAHMRDAQAYVGAAHHLAGSVADAERSFIDADRIEHVDHHEGAHLYSVRGA